MTESTIPSTRLRGSAALALAALALSSCAADVEGPPAALPAGTPVVLVVIDTLRADHLSCYGYELETSPVLDALAARASLFEANSTQVNSTFPSITSIMTGLYARTHRNYLAVPVGGQVQSNRGSETLAERLADAGYATLAAVSHPAWTGKETGSGWSEVRARSATMRGWEALSSISPEIPVEQRPLAANAGYTNQRTHALLDRYEAESSDRPLCLWVHYFDPHTDLFPSVYYPPVAYWNRYLRHHLAAVGEEALHDELAGVDPAVRHELLSRRLGDDPARHKRVAIANGRALYDAEIAYTDYELGRLFERLDRMGLFERALVVVMADHGENMEGPELERETFTFSHEKLYEGVVHTPLIVKLPGQTEGQRIDQLTQNIDVLPTVLELLGLPADEELEGRSLVPALRDPGARIHEEVFAESSNDPERAVKTDTLKLIESSPDEGARTQVFRWRDDPLEERDLSEVLEPRVVERLQSSIERFKPLDVVRLRLFPDERPYTARFEVRLEQGRIEHAIIPDDARPAADGRSVAFEVEVGDRSQDALLFLNRRNVQMTWTVQRSDVPALERLHLGRTPLRATAALPVWQPAPGAPPPAPTLAIDFDRGAQRLGIELVTGSGQEVEAALRFVETRYAVGIDVLSAEGFADAVEREGPIFRLRHFGAPRARAELDLGAPDPLLLVRIDGEWPDPARVALNGHPVQRDALRFVIPYPLDRSVTAAMTFGADDGDLPPGAMSLSYDTAAGGGTIDTAGLDEGLVRQLRALGYVR